MSLATPLSWCNSSWLTFFSMRSSLSLTTSTSIFAQIDREKRPVEVYSVVEGGDWEKAAQMAFSAARRRVHEDKDVATGVFQIHPTRVECIATAGYARLALTVAEPGNFEAALLA